MPDRRITAPILLLALCVAGCAGNGPGTDHPATAGGMAGYLARGPLPAQQPTATSVGIAGTGPAGNNSAVGDGTALLGH